MRAPGGWLALMGASEARAAEAVCWKVRKEVRSAGAPVLGSRMLTATASMELSHDTAVWMVLDNVEGCGEGEEPFAPSPLLLCRRRGDR